MFFTLFLGFKILISIHIATKTGINESAANIKKHKLGNDSIVDLNKWANNDEAIMGAVKFMIDINVNTFPNSKSSTIFERYDSRPIGAMFVKRPASVDM